MFGQVFVLCLAYYQGGSVPPDAVDRRRDLTGWVLASFDLDGFMDEIAKRHPVIDIELFDGAAAENAPLLFDSDHSHEPENGSQREGLFNRTSTLSIGGRNWTLLLRSTPEFEREAVGDRGPLIMLGAGMAICCLLARLVAVLIRRRERAHELAMTMTAALHDSEARYRNLVQAQPDLVVRMDLSGRFTFVNDTTCARFGRSREALVGSAWQDFVHPENIAAGVEGLQRVLSGSEHRATIECRLLTAAGVRWHECEAFAIFDANGAVREIQGTGHDVTARRTLEVERQDQVLFLKTLIAAIPAAVFYKNEQGTYLGFNRLFEDFLGLPADKILGRTVYDIAPQDMADIYHQSDARLLCTRQPHTYEFQRMTADGSVHHMRTHKATFDRTDGSLGGVIGIILDISTDIRREAEVQAARKAAEEANRAKSRFLVTMSHEFRTPLNSIIGFSELLQDQAFCPARDSRCVEYAQYVLQAGHHLLDIVKDVIDVSKIDAGRMGYDPIRLPVSSVCHSVVRCLRHEIEKSGVLLTVEIPADVSDLWADERETNQILANLLSNAIKFSSVGGKVLLSAQPSPGGVDLVIADNGIGMPPDKLDRILKPFEQLDDCYTRTYSGTGLGLALVKGLVALNQGRLSVESELGRGSTFTVTLPATHQTD